jgi:hypothetical protein
VEKEMVQLKYVSSQRISDLTISLENLQRKVSYFEPFLSQLIFTNYSP